MNTTRFLLLFLSFILNALANDPATLHWKTLEELHITLFSLRSLDQFNQERSKKAQPLLTKEQYDKYTQDKFDHKNSQILKKIGQEETAHFPLKFPLLTIDVVTPTKIFAGLVLNTSFDHPMGDTSKFDELLASNPPKPEQGKHWYLVISLGSQNKFTLKDFHTAYTRAYFGNESVCPYLPHVTIAEITDINDKETFLNVIERVNKLLKKLPTITTNFSEKSIILKLPSLEHPRPHIMFDFIKLSVVPIRIDLIKNFFIKYSNELYQTKEKQHEHDIILKTRLLELTNALSKLKLMLQ